MDRRIALIVIGLLLIVGTAGWLWYASARASAAPAPLTASGTLEADETQISPQVTGLITALPVSEGARVDKGTVVTTIDDRLLQLQIQQAVATNMASAQVLEQQEQSYVLRAPVSGVVTRVAVHVGETAMPGEVLLAVAPLDSLKITLYVREADLPQVSVGQHLAITADPFPNRTFSAQVTSINQQAEFTPRNVQTGSDRLNLVFGINADVANPDGSLKAGMPVEARFQAGGGT